MKIRDLLIALWMVLGVFCTACQQIAEEVDSSASSSASTTSSVTVTTRADATAQIIYPAYIYAFDADGKYVTSQTITTDGDSISLSLSPATYRIVAVAGVSKGYALPENPDLSDVIALSDDGYASTPMMMGQSDLVIAKAGRTVQLEIAMSYTVSALSICLKEVPDDVSGVRVALSTLYSNISLDGTFGGAGKVVEVECEEDDNGEWNADALYLFPSDKQELLFSIVFEYDDCTENYAYTYGSPLTAGVPFNFIGSYKGASYIEGKLIVMGWDNLVNADFNFGGTADADTEGNGGTEEDDPDDADIEVVTGTSPQVGTVWNGGIVVDLSEGTDSSTEVLLMSLDEWATTASGAAALVSQYKQSTGQAWRMMSDTEAKAVKAHFTTDVLEATNEHIAAASEDYDPVSLVDKVRYLCLKDNGVIYSFRFETTGSVTKAGSTKSYLLRMVRSVHYR